MNECPFIPIHTDMCEGTGKKLPWSIMLITRLIWVTLVPLTIKNMIWCVRWAAVCFKAFSCEKHRGSCHVFSCLPTKQSFIAFVNEADWSQTYFDINCVKSCLRPIWEMVRMRLCHGRPLKFGEIILSLMIVGCMVKWWALLDVKRALHNTVGSISGLVN